MLNAIGVGERRRRRLRAGEATAAVGTSRAAPKVIANIWDTSIDGYVTVTEGLAGESAGVDAIEVNISCPNLKEGGDEFGTDPRKAADVTRAVKEACHVPVIVKLSPNAGVGPGGRRPWRYKQPAPTP